MATVAIILCSQAQADYNPLLYCPIVKTGTKLPSLDDCHKYYVCDSSNQVTTGVCPSGQLFNKDSQGCVTTTTGACTNTDNPCDGLNGKWVPDAEYCRIWHYCKNGEIVGSGSCKEGQIFDFAKQQCVNGACSINGDNSAGVGNICQIMPNKQFFGDFNICTTWYKCDGLSLQQGQCPSNMVSCKDNNRSVGII